MFKYKRSILSLFVISAMLFTGLVVWAVAPCPWPEKLWYQLAGIWISEALLGVAVVGFGNNSGRTLPFRFGNLTVGAAHLLYSFLLLAIPCGDTGVLVWVVGGLILALFLHTLFLFARRDVKDDDAAAKRAFALRNELLAELEMFEVAWRDLIKENAELAKELEKLKDAARFASDGVPGCESADAEVREALAALKQCADAEAMTRAAIELTARIGVRQNVVKRLR